MFDKAKADHAVDFINCLKHTKGRWRGVPFELLPWQDEIIRTLYGTVKENGYQAVQHLLLRDTEEERKVRIGSSYRTLYDMR